DARGARAAFGHCLSRPGGDRRGAACVLAPVRTARGDQGRLAGRGHQPRGPQHDRRERQGRAGGSSAGATQQGEPALAHRQHLQARTGAGLGALGARPPPRRRGETESLSHRLAWERLEEALRKRLEHSFAWHDYAHSRGKIASDLASPEERAALPPQCWRMAWKNPVNGRSALYIASHAYAIEGMEQARAQKLLAELMDAATAPGLSYVHSGRKGDVVMWDTRATMHRGRPWPAHEARLMVRTTISATDADGLGTVRAPSRQAAE